MADVFISYVHKDLDVAEKIYSYLTDFGFTVWWDKNLRAGDNFPPTIELAINSAKCVIVIWSQNSITSDWVRAEATEGLHRKILAPVIIGKISPPLEFRTIQWIDISEWIVDFGHESGYNLVRAVSNICKKVPDKAKYWHSDDPLNELRRRLILARSSYELRSGLYDLEKFLHDHPYNTIARIMKDDYINALEKSKGIEAARSKFVLIALRTAFFFLIIISIILLSTHGGFSIWKSVTIVFTVLVGVLLILYVSLLILQNAEGWMNSIKERLIKK